VWCSLFNTLETLFWAMFGLIDLDHFALKESHVVTEWAGKTMFGTYGCISIIVLLNMLIAMMSNSYQYISVRVCTPCHSRICAYAEPVRL
jgi:transient receptor potential cation channel subfamily C